jgi:hypothetical protein
MTRSRRLERRRHVVLGAMGGVVIIAFFVVVFARARSESKVVVATAPTTSSISGDVLLTRIAGTYHATLSQGGSTLTLRDDGTLAVLPDGNGLREESAVFSVTGDEFRTNAFVNDRCANVPNGVYRWTLAADDSLAFVVVTDACPERRALFASSAWSRQR